MTATPIQRNTQVVSVSLDPKIVKMLDALKKKYGQTRSSAMAALIKKEALREEWESITAWGKETSKKFGFTSEEDVYRFLGDA